jgi:hypothetical protein
VESIYSILVAKRSGTLKRERSLQTRRILLGSSTCRICDAAKKFRWRRGGLGILLAGKRGGKIISFQIRRHYLSRSNC